MNVETLTSLLGQVVIGAPGLLLAIVGCAKLFDAKLAERTISRITQVLVCTGLFCLRGDAGADAGDWFCPCRHRTGELGGDPR